MTTLVALPVLVPLLGAVACLAARRALGLHRVVAIVTTALMVGVGAALLAEVATGGPVAVAVGGWAPPFAIQLRADLLGALLVLITGVIGLAVALYAVADVDDAQLRLGFWPLMLLLLMGVSGSFLTADLFNLYVWFEVMLIASFVLLALGRARAQLRASLVYVILNLIGSIMFLMAVGLLYGAVRTVDFAELGARLGALERTRPHLVMAIEALLLTSFGVKAAVFPLFFWLPASYPTPPAAVAALFAGLLTKVGVYALIRAVAAIFPSPTVIFVALALVAMATMVSGVAGALVQRGMRDVLSFHIISQIGYMVAGLALVGLAPEPALALAATIFYVIHHILVKANLFLVAGMVERLRRTGSLDHLGGVARTAPWLAAVFLISALSLAGVPPLSGFWAKLAIIEASLGAARWALAAVAVAVGLLTLASMLKLWLHVFAGPVPRDVPAGPASPSRWALVPAVALALLTIAIGLWPGPLLALATGAADQLLPGGRR